MEERKTIMMTLMMMIDVKDDESDDVVGDDGYQLPLWQNVQFKLQSSG